LKIRDVELAKVRAFNNQVSQMNKDMNKALSKALSDYEKIRSQFENIVETTGGFIDECRTCPSKAGRVGSNRVIASAIYCRMDCDVY
jgi:hypothetical protein